MLDHSLFLYGTGISDSNTHFYDDLPIAIVAGKETGIKGGRYVRHPQGTPLANLHISLLDKLGVHVDSFGGQQRAVDETGRPHPVRALVFRRGASVDGVASSLTAGLAAPSSRLATQTPRRETSSSVPPATRQ